MSSYTKILVAQLLLAGLLVAVVTGQNFHYSNGWQPGKRASIASSGTQVCSFRPHIKALLLWIIEDEVKRIKSCGSSGYDDIINLLQTKQNELPVMPSDSQ
ncbi:prepro-gonadotropin-releasing hormone-like protein [Ylistrum balloti]|uniref:prepro-gonadotropin-releasing hormone-like protein n=1 Tax=Ylistrum balloti TaxID=509963 RepID=UPI002905AD66|nr:prepro-gonadotropin-releasing hormone-like protein [Ylistrum balloti]